MISVQEAKKLILEQCNSKKTELLPLHNATGYILAEHINSPANTPPFNQSAMDGYAFSFDNWDGNSDLSVSGEIQAGNYFAGILKPSEAVRIYTGAVLPQSADTVVMQEKVIRSGNTIRINDNEIFKGSNVRLQGSQSKKGDVILFAGYQLTPAAVSFSPAQVLIKSKFFQSQ